MKSVRSLPKTTKRMAIAHMIGQMDEMTLPVRTSDVAAWLGCTKSTASAYLHDMEKSGVIHKRVENWRGDSNVYYWKLTNGAKLMYSRYAYGLHYQAVVDIKVGK